MVMTAIFTLFLSIPLYAGGGKEDTIILDENGLRPEDYDINGWAYKDGVWFASPGGAVRGDGRQARVTLQNTSGLAIKNFALKSDNSEEPVVYSSTIDNGGSYEIVLEKRTSYTFVLVDVKNQVYTISDRRFLNDTYTLTISKDNMTHSRFDAFLETAGEAAMNLFIIAMSLGIIN
jgi:hypothetical protein